MNRIVFVLLVVCLVPFAAARAAVTDRFAAGWRHYEAGQYGPALEHWFAAAAAGHAGAQLNLGLLYEFGQGVSADPVLAARWYASAAQLGLSAAQANLAALYAAGRGVPRDPAVAARWYRAAAEQGLAYAQYQLGLAYAKGDGVAADTVEARIWLGRSAAQGHVEAASELLAMASAAAPEPGFWDGASLGSAWPVSADLVVTNHHVVDGTRDIVLIDSHGRRIAAELILSNRRDDLALLRVDDSDGGLPPALPLAFDDAAPGSEVFALGYPRVDELGATPKLSAGSISAEAAVGGPRTYRLDLHVEPGYSGGPLVNTRGEVVGTVTGMLGLVDASNRLTHLIHNAGVAVKSSAIRETLALLPVSSFAQRRDQVAARGFADITRISDSIMIVVAR